MLLRGVLPTVSLYVAAVYASPTDVQEPWLGPLTNARRVPVMLGVMSRCPDALLCETLFDGVIPKVAAKIDLSLAYVARHVSSFHQSDRDC
jgi:hypothetical protein